MRENFHSKAVRYLGEARLTILHVSDSLVRATCRGDSGSVYDVGWHPVMGWSCSCPARGPCAHVRALQLITVRPSSLQTVMVEPKEEERGVAAA